MVRPFGLGHAQGNAGHLAQRARPAIPVDAAVGAVEQADPIGAQIHGFGVQRIDFQARGLEPPKLEPGRRVPTGPAVHRLEQSAVVDAVPVHVRARIEHLRIVGVDGQARNTGFGQAVVDEGPALPAVGGFDNARALALGILPAAARGDIDHLAVAGVDDDVGHGADGECGRQRLPGIAAVGTAMQPAKLLTGVEIPLARTYIQHVRVVRVKDDGLDPRIRNLRQARQVSSHSPGLAAVQG